MKNSRRNLVFFTIEVSQEESNYSLSVLCREARCTLFTRTHIARIGNRQNLFQGKLCLIF